MKSKVIVSAVIALLVIAGLVVILEKQAKNTSQNSSLESPQNTQASNSHPGQDSVNPVPTNNGSVAGVDLSGFSSEANQAAAVAAPSSSTDANAFAADGTTLNSSTDSVNNPIQ